ncbi:MAG: hypothetical protein ACLVLH_21430 [Eisenbergiella massiliensis]
MKKRMKRITAAAAACLLSLIFAACGSSSKSNTTEDISPARQLLMAGGVYSIIPRKWIRRGGAEESAHSLMKKRLPQKTH